LTHIENEVFEHITC